MDLKKRLTYIGNVIVIVSFGFLSYLLYKLDFSTVLKYFQLSWIPLIMIAAFLFSLLYFVMAAAWKRLLELSSQKPLDQHIIVIYLKTVIMKYAPGNVFHFVGRHSLKESHLLTHKTIAFANGVEILMQLLAVSLIIMTGSLFFSFDLHIGEYLALSKEKIILAFLLLLVLTSIVLWKKKYRAVLLHKEGVYALFFVLCCHLLFLLGSATILFLVYALFFDVAFTWDIFSKTLIASSIAWLLGFVVPGAPGGIGIRESILVLLLPSIMIVSKEVIFAGAVIYRVITVLGEALTYFWAKLLTLKRKG